MKTKNKSKLLLNLIFIIIFSFVSLEKALGQTPYCGGGSGSICYGIASDGTCTNQYWPDCSPTFPRCVYSGTINGYFCENHCYNTHQQSTCPAGSVCLCYDRTVCPLCTYTGQNLSACNDNGCGGADTQAPTITITSPTSATTWTSTVSPITLGGTATDNITLSQVTWSNNRNSSFVGGSGTATGTNSWNVGFINLEPGSNVITVTAIDGAGNRGTDTLTVTYSPPSNLGTPSISLTENTSDYSVSISDPDSLNEVAYAWGAKPNVYFLIPFANEDNVSLSATEQTRLNYLAQHMASDWDILTKNRLPLKFNFIPPFKVTNYSRSENDWYSYITKSISKFESDNSGSLNYPAIYVFLYPEPYFTRTYINVFGSTEKRILAEVYFSYFNDTSSFPYNDPNELMGNIMLHEIAHYFAELPNNINIPPGTNKYFWLSHPASFSGVQESCDESTFIGDCDPYGIIDSPTGTEGYYEAYSILSGARSNAKKINFYNRDPELSPLEEMEAGLRSKYDDAHYMFYEGYFTLNPDGPLFNQVSARDYNISSRRLYDYTHDINIYHSLYWNISYDNTKTTLSNTTRTFSVPKSSQSSRSLIIYAGDATNPGHFKTFGNNAHSETTAPNMDTTPPAAPTGFEVI